MASDNAKRLAERILDLRHGKSGAGYGDALAVLADLIDRELEGLMGAAKWCTDPKLAAALRGWERK